MKKWSRTKYRSEYNSYNNMKQRCKREEGVLAAAFDTFDGFMDELGEKRDPSHTVDRIDHNDPEYGPGKVRWATKQEQSNNRKNVRRLTYTGDILLDQQGSTRTITEWANELGISASTIRRRLKDRFSVNEALEGAREVKPKTFQQMTKNELLNFKPWPDDTKEEDERRYLEERKDDENRFEFERRVLLIQELDELSPGFEKVADNYSGENLSDEPDEMVYRFWVLRDRRNLRVFRRLSDQAEEIFKDVATSKEKERHWRRAFKRFQRSELQSRAAHKTERRIDLEDEEDELYRFVHGYVDDEDD